jgi:hypothetical protein
MGGLTVTSDGPNCPIVTSFSGTTTERTESLAVGGVPYVYDGVFGCGEEQVALGVEDDLGEGTLVPWRESALMGAERERMDLVI